MTIRYAIIFALLFSLTALAGRYSTWLTLPPASTHQWRQADGAAIAANYARNPDFWAPEVSNLFYAGDAHAVGEFPILYWISGCISRYSEWPAYPLRWIGLLLLFVGCWAFGWMLLQMTRSPVLAALGAGLLLGAPILVYYGPNFLPDAPAFCFVLLMAACLFRADQMQHRGWLFAAALCAVLAILLKISMAIVPLALAATWILGKWQGRWRASPLWNSHWPAALLAGIAGTVPGFYGWAAAYNAGHQTAYFLTTTRPVWNYDWPFIRETLVMVGSTGLPVYASAGLYLACLAGLWFSWKQWKSTPLALRAILVFTTLGCAAYILLWFRMFREHDYYVLCLLALPALLLVMGLRLARQRFSEKKLAFALGLFWLLGLGHNQFILSKRLHLAFHPQTGENLPPEAFLSQYHLTEAGVPRSARVLCPQDPSPNIALLALQRQGWSAYNFGDRITADTLSKYQTHFGLTHLALRDTALYGPLYRRFFPERVCETRGWQVYRR